MSVVLECDALYKSYRQGPQTLRILDQLNLTVHAGEHIAVVGASGSGKSTLLNLLGGLDQPDAGEVRILGRPFSSLSDNQRGAVRNRHLGFVYQFHHLLGEFTALENVAMPLLIGGVKRAAAREKANELLAQVGLAARVTHKPAELSGGERQRVAIARALANQPECVLMDEPTGNLDAGNAKAIQALMQALSAAVETAFIVVTHDHEFANTMDGVYELADGALNQIRGAER